MTRIVIFGAGGRAGRRIVAEALRRGHEVTSVVRDPAGHQGVEAIRGDATDPAGVANAAAGHDAVICAVYRPDIKDHKAFYLSVAQALIQGLTEAKVRRLIVIGMDTSLDNPFAQARAAELAYLKENAGGLDWHYLVPPPVVLTDQGYADLAAQTLDRLAH